MCGIAGIFRIRGDRYPFLSGHLRVMGDILAHRGPDDSGVWTNDKQFIGFAHRRLEIIDLETGHQPMSDHLGNTICYNGEIYNYPELKRELNGYPFKTTSDTEVILAAYAKWGEDCVNHLRGMFAFAIWDERREKLFLARDRFGIKPFYFSCVDDTLYFASESKALMPFLKDIETNYDALRDYLVFQFCPGSKTLFQNVRELPPAHYLVIENGRDRLHRYWEVYYHLDFHHTEKYFIERLRSEIEESVRIHTRSDVPIGAYVSGGLDSGIIASLASAAQITEGKEFVGFNGRFADGPEYDESAYAAKVCEHSGFPLKVADISSRDFVAAIEKIIYHMDYPVAGPGSFPQYFVSRLASEHRKVVLGGQGGDEIFGGYTRYLIAYFEQCIKAAINDTMNSGNFIVTYESIIKNLKSLKNYQPLLQEFWKEGLFDSLDKRYFRLINRAPSLQREINWNILGQYSPFETFVEIFHGHNVDKESYFDSMTHFDFKTLLPALLQVEDRMSMAHSIESRVPFLDHKIVELAATIPSNIKFKNGTLKRVLIRAMEEVLPHDVIARKDKMGFPVPLNKWLKDEIREFVFDIFNSHKIAERPYFNKKEILANLNGESKFGRKIWGLLSLELWHRQFHDKRTEWKSLLSEETLIADSRYVSC